MLKLSPALKSYLWGGRRLAELFGRDNGGKIISESWEVSVHPDGPSRYEGGTLAEYLAAHPRAVDAAGSPLPVLIKYIDAKQNLSVQVHPNDEYARRVEGDNGKTEFWYVVRAEKGAGIYCGFKQKTSPQVFLERLGKGRAEELLNFIPVRAGDRFLIEAGTVHAIGAGCLVCEVQQSSNVSYRVYDYGRKDENGNLRPLQLDKALDVIDFGAYADRTGGGETKVCGGARVKTLTDCRYFRCRELKLDGEYAETNEKSFLACNAVAGEGEINGTPFACGDSFFIPRGEGLRIKGNATCVLTDADKPIG